MDADRCGSAFGATEDDKKVLIIGAGCTGLALAHGLKKVMRLDTKNAPATCIHTLLELCLGADGKYRLGFPTSCMRVEATLAR